jgi:pyridoxal phosphate enzyme (YggS family)
VESVGDRYQRIRERVGRAASAVGRDGDDVVLVGASKRQPVERLLEAWDAGLRVFGENRVQEALDKQARLPAEAEWHLIGPLQSNKARRAIEAFGTIQSVDRPKIARRLDAFAAERGRALDGFIEVNLGDEPSKHGFAPDRLLDAAEPLLTLEHLRIVGLMTIPPQEEDPGRTRAWLRRLRELRDLLFSRPGWSERPGYLSMGMSDDYTIAVEEGATHVRIGTALFGPRRDGPL